MKNQFHFFLFPLLLLVMLVSSCFDVEEEYWFNKDGSGTAEIRMDLSEMMKLMETFGDMMPDSADSDNPLSDFDLNDSSSVNNLREAPGISNVVNLNNMEEKVIGYRFDFKDLEALNNAMGYVNSDLQMGNDNGGDKEAAVFRMNGKSFERSVPSMEDMGEEVEMAKAFMGDSKYSVKIHFEQKIKKVDNSRYVTSKDGKTLLFESSMLDLMSGKHNLDVGAKLK